MAIKIRRVQIYIPAPKDVMPQKDEDSLQSIPWSAYIEHNVNKFSGECRKIPNSQMFNDKNFMFLVILIMQ